MTISFIAARPEEDDVPEPQLRGEQGVPQVHRRAGRLRLPLLRLRPHPAGVEVGKDQSLPELGLGRFRLLGIERINAF